jgi:hypothetical protein
LSQNVRRNAALAARRALEGVEYDNGPWKSRSWRLEETTGGMEATTSPDEKTFRSKKRH